MKDKIKVFLEEKTRQFNNPAFIKDDPVSIPHLFSKKADIEIAGLFAALFAWGNRTTIINKSRELMQLMEMAPHDFILNHEPVDLKRFLDFRHRTFTPTDLLVFIQFLQNHYRQSSSLETAFFPKKTEERDAVEKGLHYLYERFSGQPDFPSRTRKHLSTPYRKSSCKRLNMYLRWMVRSDNCGVDFGIWENISPAQLVCPVDVHVSRVAKKLQLIHRIPVDWKAAVELTEVLKEFDPGDPVKYDFALFSLGVNERF